MTQEIHQSLSDEKKQKIFAFCIVVSIFLPYYVTAVAIAAGGIYVLCSRERRAWAMAEPFSRLILAVFPLWSLISLAYQNFLGAGVALVIVAALLTAFYLRSFMTQRLFHSLLDVACLCSLSSTMVAFGQILYYAGTGDELRAESVCMNPNYYGMLMEFVAIIALYRLFGTEKNRRFYMVVLASSLLGIYFCASISAAAVVCGSILLFLLLRGRYKYCVIFTALGAVAVIAALTVLPIIFPRASDADHSMDQRLSIWHTALQGILQHPLFGQGPVTYEMIYTQFSGYATHHAHNLILDTFLNYGVVGASLIGFFLLYQLRLVIRRIRRGISSSTGVLLLVMTFATFAHGMTDTTVMWLQTGLLFLLVYSSVGIRSEVSLPVVPAYAKGLLPVRQEHHG